MSNTPYRILFYQDATDDLYHQGWQFDDEEFETAETAFNTALNEYEQVAFRVVKLCYPKED
jgi:hypothetical protein